MLAVKEAWQPDQAMSSLCVLSLEQKGLTWHCPSVCQGLHHFAGASHEAYMMWLLCRDITDGTYFPAASLFTDPSQTEGATVTFNFGEFGIPFMAATGTHRPSWHTAGLSQLAMPVG